MSLINTPSLRSQKGQALAEGLIIMLVLLLLLTAIAWLNRLFDISLQSQHASSYMAMQKARHPKLEVNIEQIKQDFFLSPSHQWSDRQGNKIVQNPSIALSTERNHVLSDQAQTGKNHQDSKTLRQEWAIEDEGIVHAQVQVSPLYQAINHKLYNSLSPDLDFFDRQKLILSRSIHILVDADHASSDIHSQNRMASSATAWINAANQSKAAGQTVQGFSKEIDSGWDRDQPSFDWISAWKAYIPEIILKNNKP